MKKTLITTVFALAISIFLIITVSAEDNNFYKNGSDFVEINGGEFYSNIDDQDKLYYFDKTTQSHTKILDDHIITMVDVEDTIYLISYADGKSKLLGFSTTDNSAKEISLLYGVVNNVCIRDNILYYILDGSIYGFDLLSNNNHILVEDGNIDLCYFTEYNSLTFFTKNVNNDYDKNYYDFSNGITKSSLEDNEISLQEEASSYGISLMAASTYTPRLSAPSTTDPYYTTWNVFHTSGYGMVGNNGNCTCYAYGRSYENLGYKPSLSTGNAGGWYSYNVNNGYYSYGKTPYLGAVAVWTKPGAAGHVAVVEVIDGDTVTTSESGWNSFYFKTVTRSASNSNFSASSSYNFQGFIYVMGYLTTKAPTSATPVGTQTISNGRYHIVTACNNNKALTVADKSKAENANIQIWDHLNEAEQTFQVTYLNNGYYEIYNTNSGKSLDVPDSATSPGTNLSQHTRNNSDAQKWVIQYAGNGYYNIISKCNGLYIDLKDGQTFNGNNILLWTGNSGTMQKWRFVAYGTSNDHKLSDGVYHIVSACNNKKALTVADKSKTENANIQIWDHLNEIEQTFMVKYLNNGYYEIYNMNSGKSLDVPDSATVPGTNLSQHSRNGSDAQKWIIRDTGDGYYNIISKCNGLYIDLKDGQTYNGNNILLWIGNSGTMQKWKFIAYNYKVEFNANGGTTPTSSKNVIYNSTYGTLPTPKQTGYTFKGWYTAKSGGTHITSSTKVTITNDQTLYAQWTANTYTVKYNGNGATGGSTASSTHTYNAAKSLTANGFSRTGYTFLGWSTSSSATSATYSNQQSVINFTSINGATINLYAVWKKNSYILHVRPRGGTWNGSTGNQSFSLAYQDTKSISNPTKTGYTFAAWALDFSGTNHKITGSGTSGLQQVRGVPLFSDPVFSSTNGSMSVYNNKGNGTVTLSRMTKDSSFEMSSGSMMKITTSGEATPGLGGFFQYTYSKENGVFYHVIAARIPVGYNINYASNLNSSGSQTWLTPNAGTGKWETYIYKTTTNVKNVTFGHVYISGPAATASNPVTWYVGYAEIFDATNTSASGNTYTMGSGAGYLQALWVPNKYTVKYNGNGATSGSMSNSTHIYDTAKTLTENAYVRDGYEFLGWSTDSSASAVAKYTNKQSVTNLSSTSGATVTLYAKWTPNTYTLTFDANGGAVEQTSKNITYDSTYGTLPTPTRNNYQFKGWYTAKENGTLITDTTKVSTTTAQTLYAQWEKLTPYTQIKKVDNNNYSVELFNLDSGCTVILATYQNHKLVEFYPATYDGNKIPFTTTKQFDTIKVMAWSNFTTLKPLCEVNSTVIE